MRMDPSRTLGWGWRPGAVLATPQGTPPLVRGWGRMQTTREERVLEFEGPEEASLPRPHP